MRDKVFSLSYYVFNMFLWVFTGRFVYGKSALIRMLNSKNVTVFIWAALYVVWLFVLIMRV